MKAEEKEFEETQMKDMFVATLVHDLKNPIHAQLFGLNLLKKGTFGNVNREQREVLDLITESVSFMNELIYSALDIYRFDNCENNLKKSLFNLGDLIKKCIKELNFAAKEKNLNFVFRCFTEDSEIYADETSIRRTLTNLLTNAVTYSFDNSDIHTEIYGNKNDIVIKIRNTGEEISEKIKTHIFEKFVTGCSGNGLGLYYCKKTIDAHGGLISLNTKGNISEFVINLPV